MVQCVRYFPTERQRTGHAGHDCNGIDSIRATREFRVGSDTVRVSPEHLYVGSRRENRVGQLHHERVRLERQLTVGDESRGIVDRTTWSAPYFVAELADAARIVGFHMDCVGHFDTSAMTARVIESGVSEAILVDDRHRVDLSSRLNVDRD